MADITFDNVFEIKEEDFPKILSMQEICDIVGACSRVNAPSEPCQDVVFSFALRAMELASACYEGGSFTALDVASLSAFLYEAISGDLTSPAPNLTDINGKCRMDIAASMFGSLLELSQTQEEISLISVRIAMTKLLILFCLAYKSGNEPAAYVCLADALFDIAYREPDA